MMKKNNILIYLLCFLVLILSLNVSAGGNGKTTKSSSPLTRTYANSQLVINGSNIIINKMIKFLFLL
jgi:hypothetical protein